MSKKSKTYQTQKSLSQQASSTQTTLFTSLPNYFFIWLFASVLITFIANFPTLNNLFINLDDNGYVLDNPMIKTFDSEHLKQIFSNPHMGNYQPLTILTYAIEYHFFKLDPFYYHLTNLILHLFNTAVLFYFIYLIQYCTKSVNDPLQTSNFKLQTSFITSVLFGVHPLHIESVGWISGRKDVLYGLFFLLSSVFYLFYLMKEKRKYFWFTLSLFCFIASVLSKAMAVSLVGVLLLIDYYVRKKISYKIIFNKLPFIVISLVLGIIAFNLQKHEKAFQGYETYTLIDRILFAFYGFSVYIFKFIYPYYQAAYYPYPEKANGLLPANYYLFIIPTLIIVFFVYRSFKKNKDLFFGIGYYLATVFLVLQLLPVGSSVISERYTYLPLIGIGFLNAKLFSALFSKSLQWNVILSKITQGLIIAHILLMSVICWNRYKVWHDSEVFWTDLIELNPILSYAYASRGLYYYNEKKDKVKALKDFDTGLAVDKKSYKTYLNRGFFYIREGDYPKALFDFNQAIKIKSDIEESYNNRGSIYYFIEKYDSAAIDYSKVIELNPSSSEAYGNRANTYKMLGKYEDAIRDYNTYIGYYPKHLKAFNWRGTAKRLSGDLNGALSDINKALQLNSSYDDAYYQRALVYRAMGNISLAQADEQKAKSLGFDFMAAEGKKSPFAEFNDKGSAFFNKGRYDSALVYYTKAIQADSTNKDIFGNRANAYSVLKMFDLAIYDYTIFLERNPTHQQAFFWRGIAKHTLGDIPGAINDYTKAIEVNPSLGNAYLERAKANLILKKKDLVKPDLDQARALGINTIEVEKQLLEL